MKRLGLLCGGAVLTLFGGCAMEEEPPEFDEAQLAQYRRALPSRAQLEATAPTPTTATANGDPALYPHASAEIVLGINGTVRLTVDMLDLITSTPPTVYNSDTLEYSWGPYPADDFGYWSAYIRDVGDQGDFRYEFAFVRGYDNDLANLTPVVYGGGTPDQDNEDYGVGVVVWDITASNAFEEEHNPAFDPTEHDSGRFAALFGLGPAEDDPDAEFGYVVAAFRNYVSADDLAAEPVDLDYLYGRYLPADEMGVVDFIDWQANIDVSTPKDDVYEDVGVRMVFVDEGTGRAEADAIGGSLEANQQVDAIECWDTSINQTYISFELSESGNVTTSFAEGEPTNCGLFDATLDSLDVPSLEDLDPALLAALDDAAENGLPE